MEAKMGSGEPVRVLVVSRDEEVRRQLVAHLGRSGRLVVTGGDAVPAVISTSRPAVVVLDLSRVRPEERRRLLAQAAGIDAAVVALASLHDPHADGEVRAAGGVYRLKAVGDDGLVDAALAAADRRVRGTVVPSNR
jgi:hypothetical protein